MTEPSERSMERARELRIDISLFVYYNSDDGAERLERIFATALDEAREEGIRLGRDTQYQAVAESLAVAREEGRREGVTEAALAAVRSKT